MCEWTVQECYCARLCHRVKSQSVKQITNKFKSCWKLLSMAANVNWTIHQNKCQWSVNNLWFKYGNCTVIWSLLYITDILAPFTGKRDSNPTTTAFWKWASMERQRFLASHLGWFMFWLVSVIQLSDIGSLYWEELQWHAPCRILRMSVNGVSMIFGFTSWVIYVWIGCRHPFIWYLQPLLGRTTATCSLPHTANEHQWSVNDF